MVVDKQNGGKPDAFVAGTNYSHRRDFLALDAEFLLGREALSNALCAVLVDPDRVVAVGGKSREV